MATEKRLIEVNALIAKFPVIGQFEKDLWHSATIRAAIDDAPTVDAVEVVRCGNCKHFREPFCCRRDDETHRERINMLTVDFCSYGERKDND